MKARRDDNSGGGRLLRCTVGYPRMRWTGWICLIIGLMLLAAVHGLRLGALVQLLTFGGFLLGFLLGTVVWVPLLRTGHESPTRSVVVVSLVMLTACTFGYTGRVLGTWSNVTVRRHHLGHVDAVLGVGVAVVAVLLSVWLVAAVVSSPNSRFTSLDAAVARSDILHSIDRVLPQAPSIFNDLQTFLNNQGFPQVFSTLTPPSTPSVSTPTNAETRALADPAVFSTVKILGTGVQQRAGGIGLRGRAGARGHQRPRRGRREQRQHTGAARDHCLCSDARAVRPLLRPGCPAHECAARPGPRRRSQSGAARERRLRCSATRRTGASPSSQRR